MSVSVSESESESECERCLPRNLHFEVHQVLCLPRNVHFEVHQVLYLPRNLHFEVHQALCLPRNLHLEVHKVICLPRNLRIEVHHKCCACHEILYIEGHRVLCLPRNLRIEGHIVLRLPGNPHRGSQSAAPATKSANEPHVQKSQFTAPVTKSELLDDHRHVQSAAPATKSAFRSQTPPIPCTCHEKSTLEHQNTRFPLRLPRKVITMCENADGTTTRAQLLEAPAADTQILRACAVEMHIDMNVL